MPFHLNRDAVADTSTRQDLDQGSLLGREAPHDTQPTMYDLAHRCLKAFKRLRFTLEQPDPLYSELISLPAVDDENGRFRGWASNIGVLKTDRSSLDFRLRDVTFLSDNVITLLDSLQVSLLEVTEIITGTKALYEVIPENRNDYDSESSFESEESSESQDRRPATPIPEVQQHYLAIVDAIDRLYKLSMVIRSPQLRNRSTKAEIFIERDSEGRDVSADFEHYAITRALHQMCTWKNKTNPANLTDDEKALATRLGKANSRRRRQFMYDQRHHRKLANFEHNFDEEEERNTLAPEVSEVMQGGQGFNNAPKMPANPFKALTILSRTTATKYITPPKQPSDNRSTASGSTAYSGYQMSDISIPAAPEDKFNKEFQCPYCYMILPAKTRRADVWRKHVMKDLQPYICIYDPCSTQDILYDSEAAWLKHEEWEHAYQWCCDSPDHPLAMFPGADEFKNHMREAHSETFQEHQLQVLADASKRPSLAAFEFCPLCGVTSESLGNPQASGETSIPDTQPLAVPATIRTKDDRFVTTKALEDLQKHVACHLWHSAVIALPGRDDLDEAKSVSNVGSQKAKSDTFDISDTPIDRLEPCPFVEEFEEPAELTLSDNELLWERVFEVVGDRYGEDLGLEKVLMFAWPRDGFQQADIQSVCDLQSTDPRDDTITIHNPNDLLPEVTSQQLLGVSTPPAERKRSHSRDGNLSEPSPLTTPGTNGNSHYANNFASQPSVKVPWYLNQQRAQIQKRFQDLEWHQRFRLQHAFIHPDTSPFRMDRSDTVITRNRYGNIQPWDPLRVRLRTPIDGSDYINASPISLKSRAPTPSTRSDSTPSIKLSEMKYIATQGPIDGQFEHFWQMVMQEIVGSVGVIVMLTQCYEGIREKCSQYFPHDLESPVLVLDTGELEAEAEIDSTKNSEIINAKEPEAPAEHLENIADAGDKTQGDSQEATSAARPCSGSVTLLSINMDPQSRCEIRRMRLEIGGETKEIYHYLFNGWPDYGIPEGDDRRALPKLARQTRERAQPSESNNGDSCEGSVNPRFVHCSAGVGRTGTFIALDWLLTQLEQGNLVPKAIKQDSNLAAFQENSSVNGGGKTETWEKSGPVTEKESAPEAWVEFDLIFDTVNKLREQRMMMVLNEVQYLFLYEAVKGAFVEKYPRALMVGVVDIGNIEEVNSKDEPVGVGGGDEGATPGSQQEDAFSEAETEIEGDPYQAVAPRPFKRK